MANCLVVGTQQYMSEPFSPTLENYVVGKLSGAVFVDVWDNYHVGSGEVHCGSNPRRLKLLSTLWWSQINEYPAPENVKASDYPAPMEVTAADNAGNKQNELIGLNGKILWGIIDKSNCIVLPIEYECLKWVDLGLESTRYHGRVGWKLY